MLDVGPDVPDLDKFDTDPDEWRDPFKRRTAMLMVGVTLFGSLVAYAEARSSNRESRAAREVQRQAVRVLGERSQMDNTFLFEYDVYTRIKLLDRQRVEAQRSRRSDEAQRLADVKAALGDLSPLVTDQRYADDRRRGFSGLREADLFMNADRAELTRAARAETQDDWSHKANAYIAILTVLAVSLFLFGLSLSSPPRVRMALVVPGVGLALACLVWSLTVLWRPVDEFSFRAVNAAAEGDRLIYRAPFQPDEKTARDDVRKAIDAYSQAIRWEPRYAQAYARRAEARVMEGSSQSPLETFGGFSTTAPASLRAAISDARQAFQLGGDDDIEVVGSLATKYFLDGRHAEAVDLNRRAAELNDSVSWPWFNVAANQVATGNEEEAEGAFREAFERLGAYSHVFFSVSRTDLEVIAKEQPERTPMVERFQGLLAEEQLREAASGFPETNRAESLRLLDSPPPDGSLEIGEMQVHGPDVVADFTYRNIPTHAPVLAVVASRPDATKPWAYSPEAGTLGTFQGNGQGSGYARVRVSDCPKPGEYRIDLYSGNRLLDREIRSFEPGGSETLIPHSDAVVGATMCRPEGWALTRTEDGTR
ncbi:MAG: tetratricopeptide repeat protein [Actinobacteria bacterium]|nr:tetratricopeptide repeat protein [Actinomycetota bacterium]